MPPRPRVCSVVGCEKAGAGWCLPCLTVYCSSQCQLEDWPEHQHSCPHPPPPMEWFTASNNSTSSGQQSPGIQGKVIKPLESEERKSGLIIEQIQENLKTCQERLNRFHESSRQITLSPIQPQNKQQTTDILEIPDSPIKPVKNLDPIVDPPERQEKPDSFVNHQGSSDSSTKLRESSDSPTKPQESSTPENIKNEKRSSGSMKAPEISPVRKDGDYQLKMAVKAAQVSRELPVQIVEQQKLYELHSVAHFQSPSDFSIRLKIEEALCQELVDLMTSDPPVVSTKAWKVQLGSVLSVSVKDHWYRGLAVSRVNNIFSVYLLDLGKTVAATEEALRPLTTCLLDIPPYAYQVSLSGVVVGPDHSKKNQEKIKELVMDSNKKTMVEFLGQLEGGRWLIRLERKETQKDLSKFLLDRKFCVCVSDPPISFPLEEKEEEAVVGPIVPRGEMPLTGIWSAGICYYSRPDKFYICPSDKVSLYLKIKARCQASSTPGRVHPVLGTCCLARDGGGEFFRAEITELSEDQQKVSVFLIDYGKTLEAEVSELKVLPPELSLYPGLVMLCHLRGVRPSNGSGWSPAERDAGLLLLDAGGETNFQFYDVNYISGNCFVNACDSDHNDVASLMVETEVAVRDNSKLQPPPSVLEPGEQELQIISALGPLQLYLANRHQFQELSRLVDNAALTADYVNPATLEEGALVLAESTGVWHRARITKILPNNFFRVDLFDFDREAEVELNEIGRVAEDLMKIPVLMRKCALHSFYGREEEAPKSNEKLKSLVAGLETVMGEVVGEKDGLCLVRIPSLEKKLMERSVPEVSKRHALLEKLKSKKLNS